MERFSGALMVLAGVALGAYSFLPAINGDPTVNLAESSAIAATSDHNVRLVAPTTVVPAAAPRNALQNSAGVSNDGVRVFSPKAPLVAAVPGANSASTTTWTAVVTTERAASGNLTSAKAGDAEARAHLTSDLQRELTRVGCYSGEINGAWTQSTRRAMALFMERVNATLPASEPDYILLTLVQNHTALACGTDCPAGQVYGNDGRCLPAAVVAQANRRAQRIEERIAERRDLEQRKAAQQEQLAAEHRVAEARRVVIAQRAEAERLAASRVIERRKTAQRVEAARLETERTAAEKNYAQRLAAAAGATSSGAKAIAKPAQVAAIKSERLPWLEDPSVARIEPRPTETATAATTNRAAPLPGMMSVGAARAAEPNIALQDTVIGEPAATGTAATVRQNIARDSIDRDDLTAQRNYPIAAPAPQPAVRPAKTIRQAALITGLPGTKSGANVRMPEFAEQQPRVLRKYAPAKIIRRPPPYYYSAPRVKPKYYASGGKTRRGQPRQGTARYNLLHTLGGIY